MRQKRKDKKLICWNYKIKKKKNIYKKKWEKEEKKGNGEESMEGKKGQKKNKEPWIIK